MEMYFSLSSVNRINVPFINVLGYFERKRKTFQVCGKKNVAAKDMKASFY